MATDSLRDQFLLELQTARTALKERVSELRASLQQREDTLTAELDALEGEYTEKQDQYKTKVTSLLSIRTGIEEQFTTGAFDDLKNSILQDTDRKIHTLNSEYPPYHVSLVWEREVNEKIRDVGRVLVTLGTSTEADEVSYPASKRVKTEMDTTTLVPITLTADYASRVRPIFTLGQADLRCNHPQGLAYYPRDNSVFIVEDMSSRVVKFYIETKLVERIKVPHCNTVALPDNNDIMRSPAFQYGVCIKNEPANESVFISRRTRLDTPRDVIAVYAMPGNRVKPDVCESTGCQHMYYIGRHGTANGELNRPAGIAFDDPHLYVCDCKNNRVNVYTGFCTTRTITDRHMSYPLDVKLHRSAVFVLNSKPPFVLEFDSIGLLRNVFLYNYILCDFIPCFFCIDSTGRFLISDRKQPYVYVMRRHTSMEQALETRLELKHGEDRLVEPRGVCLDREGRVIVVCNYKDAMLQIF